MASTPQRKTRLSIQSSDLYEIAKLMAEGTDLDESDASPEKVEEDGTNNGNASDTRAKPRAPNYPRRRSMLVQNHRSHKSVLYNDTEDDDTPEQETTRESTWSPVRKVALREARRRLREANMESDTSSSSEESSEDDEEQMHGFEKDPNSTMYKPLGTDALTPNANSRRHYHNHHHNRHNERMFDKIKKHGVVCGLRKTIIEQAKRVLPKKTKKTFKIDKVIKSHDLFVPHEYIHFEEEDLFSNGQESHERYKHLLNWPQRLFVLMEHPNSSRASWAMSIFISLVTFVSVLIYICASIPEVLHDVSTCAQPACDHDDVLCRNMMVCEPEPPEWFECAENACLYIFVADYFLRLFLVTTVSPRVAGIPIADMTELDDWTISTTHIHRKDPPGVGFTEESISTSAKTTMLRDDDDSVESESTIGNVRPGILSILFMSLQKIWYYESHIMNIVDLIAILPFFIEASGLTNGHTLSIIRVLRLARILRVLKLGKGSKGVQVLLATMVASFPAILILGFFSLIGITLLGALQYFFEGGTFTVSEAFPRGEYLVQDKTATFDEPSKFNSIPMAMYWSIISSTGVGFGDIIPTTYAGRFIAIVAMYGGILVLALPISVIGNNFERIYDQSKGHLSYGVVNSVLELMEDDQTLDDLIQTCTVEADLYVARRHLIEHRASKFACVYVIAHVCLKAAEAEDINVLLSKVGLREIISALEYVYDLEFRQAQLLEFVRSTISDTAVEWDVEDPQGSYEGLRRSPTSEKDEEARIKLLQAKVKKNAKVRATAEHLLIGKYEYGHGEVEIDWQKIENNEMDLYEEEYNALNMRAKEVVRYLRKAPHDRPPGWLELHAAEVRREMGVVSTAHERKSRINLKNLENHPLKMMDKHITQVHETKRRIHLAYKRLEMAMHAVELENNAWRTETLSGLTRPRSSDSDISDSEDDGDNHKRTPKQKTPFIDSGGSAMNLTPGTDYRHVPSGDTPLPNDSGSPWRDGGSGKHV